MSSNENNNENSGGAGGPPPSNFSSNHSQRPEEKKKDNITIFFSENWKQKVMVKRDGKYKALTGFTMSMEMLASMSLLFMAMAQPGLTVPAVAAIGYTTATVNNSFDRNLHGLMGLLDSPVAIWAVCALMASQIGAAGGFFFFLAALPFFFDGTVSTISACRSLTDSARVVEINDENQESFIQADDTVKADKTMSPSEVILPASVQDSPVGNLLSRNWRDNAFREDNGLDKQLLALLMVAGYAVFGTQLAQDGEFPVVAAGTLTYAASGLLGYFGLGSLPIIAFSRINFLSVIMAFMGVAGLMTGSHMSIPLLIITAMHMFDTMQGLTQEDSKTEFLNQGNAREQAGPVARFFLDSWKSDSFHRKDYMTCQMLQLCMIGAQFYLAMICAANGSASMTILAPFIMFILASVYSYFSPVRLSGVDAVQSNGAQVALLGASTYQIVAGAGTGIPFYMLFSLLALDTLMSCSQFFDENSHQVARNSARSMGLLEKGGDSTTNSEYNRQR